MEMNKGNEQSKKQLDLFSEENHVNQQECQISQARNVGKEMETGSAKVIPFASPRLSEIYERILNRTMS